MATHPGLLNRAPKRREFSINSRLSVGSPGEIRTLVGGSKARMFSQIPQRARKKWPKTVPLKKKERELVRIRRIQRSDSEREFETGVREFDYDAQGQRIDLGFLYEKDRSGESEFYILEEGNELVGILGIQRQKDSLYLSHVGVREGYKGKGYGAM